MTKTNQKLQQLSVHQAPPWQQEIPKQVGCSISPSEPVSIPGRHAQAHTGLWTQTFQHECLVRPSLSSRKRSDRRAVQLRQPQNVTGSAATKGEQASDCCQHSYILVALRPRGSSTSKGSSSSGGSRFPPDPIPDNRDRSAWLKTSMQSHRILCGIRKRL